MAETSSGESGGRTALIVAGPTASGKSALALDVAEAFNGVIINADSMQLYADLRVVTARPSDADLARAPHALYGTVSADQVYSAGRWVEAAKGEANAAWAAGRLPIFCGGTGFYLAALTEGLSPMPDVPGDVRQAVRGRQEDIGAEAFHAELAEADPESAARLNPSDRQRVARAMEIYEATGRSLSEWFTDTKLAPALDAQFLTLVLNPPRAVLYAGIEARFDAMMQAGALAEVCALLAQNLDPAVPAMKALGVPELGAAIRGEVSLEDAVIKAKQKSRNYAKRQLTWLRHRLPDAHVEPAQYSESAKQKFFPIVREFLLTP